VDGWVGGMSRMAVGGMSRVAVGGMNRVAVGGMAIDEKMEAVCRCAHAQMRRDDQSRMG
jgi:hypothetical protein